MMVFEKMLYGDMTESQIDSVVQINDTTTIMTQLEESKDSDAWHTEAGFYVAQGISGVQEIDLDYARSYNCTAYIRRVRLEIWKVG